MGCPCEFTKVARTPREQTEVEIDHALGLHEKYYNGKANQ